MMRPWLAGLALVCAAVPSRAQVEAGGPVEICRLPADAPETAGVDDAWSAPLGAARRLDACPAAEQTARFEVEYVGFPSDARAAFQAAIDAWACRVASSQTIRVLARWEALGGSTLGTAGPYLFRNFDWAPLRDTWYPAALADDVAGRDLAAGEPDVLARFNSTFTAWHLDPATSPPPDQYDLYTVVLHEVAHGLGFIGSLTVENGLGYVGAVGETRGPYSYDRFTEDATGTPLLDRQAYPDGSAALADVLQSGDVRFDGPAVRQATGERVRLYAPPVWSEGASYSHLDEASFPPRTPDGLMTPFLGRGEAIEAPGAAVCGVLADVGWRLAGDCEGQVGVLPDVRAVLAVERTGSNPFSRQTALRVTSGSSGRVRATLVDVVGREMAVLADRPAGVGESVDLEVRAEGLAPGVYFVHVVSGLEERLVPVVVVR